LTSFVSLSFWSISSFWPLLLLSVFLNSFGLVFMNFFVWMLAHFVNCFFDFIRFLLVLMNFSLWWLLFFKRLLTSLIFLFFEGFLSFDTASFVNRLLLSLGFLF
jgi:hypothetical protein